MSGLDKNRFRNKTVAFRVSYEERLAIDERIAISGLPKGTYFIRSALDKEIVINVGKFESDRLSLEFRRMREALQNAGSDDNELYAAIVGCRALFEQMLDVMEANAGNGKNVIRDEKNQE